MYCRSVESLLKGDDMLTHEKSKVTNVTSSNFIWLPPFLIYAANGMQGLTAVSSMMFIKEYLCLSADSVAGLFFWLTLPWSLKLPMGTLVDRYWRYRSFLLLFGVALVALGNVAIYFLLLSPESFGDRDSLGSWFCLFVLLPPFGFAIQDVIADAITIDIAKEFQSEKKEDTQGRIQSLGRVFYLVGVVVTGLVSFYVLYESDQKPLTDKANLYAVLYLMGLFGPFLGFIAVLLEWYRSQQDISSPKSGEGKLGRFLAIAGIVYASLCISFQAFEFPYEKETVAITIFLASFALFQYVISKTEASKKKQREILATSLVLWICLATPEAGPGLQWWQIDELGFDAGFFTILSLSGQIIALLVVFALSRCTVQYWTRVTPWVIGLAVFQGCVCLPDLFLFYDGHQLLSEWSGIAISPQWIVWFDNAAESPLRQVVALPVLIWVAKHAPLAVKATYFAVATSFINSSTQFKFLCTEYINQVFVVSRQLPSASSGATLESDYTQLGSILLVVLVMNCMLPLIALGISQVLVGKKGML